MAGIFKTLPDGLDEVDVIIAGGGTAGCIIAARLSDADPNLSVLVIEGGQDNYNNPTVIHPLLFLSHWAPTSKATLFYKGQKESNVGDREMVVMSGGILGGGSSINVGNYSRGVRSDFDSWKTSGWSADDLVPFMKKLETYHGPGSAATHGSDGPLHISSGTYNSPRADDEFLKAAAQLGWPEITDGQDLDTINGFQRVLRYIDRKGRRQDSAHAYLHPRLQDTKHPNLRVLVENQVVRVLFNEKKKAVGVSFVANPKFQDDTTVRTVKARKMVVVSSGALGSPLLLERSGLGDPEILKQAGIEVVADVPGVGNNYLDHTSMAYGYMSDLKPEETADEVTSGRLDVGELIATDSEKLGWNACGVVAKMRPSETEAAAFGDEFQKAWDQDFKDQPNRPVAMVYGTNCFPGDPSTVPVGQYMGTTTFNLYPYSQGHIHTKGPEVNDAIDFETGFLSDTHDLDIKTMMWVYKKQREIMRRTDMYRGELAAGHPPFPAGSNAACGETENPLTDVHDIVYTEDDNDILEKWIRENATTTWHSMGTCKMAPRDQMGVVDPTLSVYGVEGLKVADLSIPPSNVCANTANTAFVIGEKAADIFIKELGLSK